MTMRVEMRAAIVGLLETYAASLAEPLKLQIWPGHPRSIHPPTAYIDLPREERLVYGDASVGAAVRTVRMDVVLLHGPSQVEGRPFDSSNAVNQADALVDGFTALVDTTPHAIGGNSLISIPAVEDDPTFVPDWVGAGDSSYYATRITLEGYVPGLTI